MTQQSNTPEYFNAIIARLERERDEASQSIDGLSNLLCNIQDTLRSRGFTQRPLDEAVIAMAQERDQLRKVADELHWLASLADYDNHRRDDALFSYNNLPHVIARKETKI